MLDTTGLPRSLYHKAKQLMWDPRDIDLSRNQRDWQRLSAREHDLILRLSAQFHMPGSLSNMRPVLL